MWRTLRQINPRTMKKLGPTPVQCIDGPEGPATTFAEIRSVWHDHFSNIAFDTSFQEILDSTRLHQDSIRGSFPLGPDLLPTIPQLEQIFRNAKGDRATGPDSLPDELSCFVPQDFVLDLCANLNQIVSTHWCTLPVGRVDSHTQRPHLRAGQLARHFVHQCRW